MGRKGPRGIRLLTTAITPNPLPVTSTINTTGTIMGIIMVTMGTTTALRPLRALVRRPLPLIATATATATSASL